MGHLAGWAAEIKAIADGPGVVFSGALVKLTADESMPNGTHTDIPWDAEVYDVGDWWSNANPTRLTVPTGVTRVIVSTNVIWAINDTGERWLGLFKNAALGLFFGQGSLRHLATNGSELNVTSAVVEVVAGDFFVANVRQTSGGNLNVLAQEASWFAIRANP
jgi:hypothetical protein